MRAFRSSLFVVYAIFCVFLQLAMPIAVGAQRTEVELPAGTKVTLVFPETISSKTLLVGQKITLRVKADVVVDGAVVIKSEAAALGEITQASKPGVLGSPGAVGVTLRTVEAVDGSSVPISGNMAITGVSKMTTSLVVTLLCCILGILIKGGDAQILQGTAIDASVVVAAKVGVE